MKIKRKIIDDLFVFVGGMDYGYISRIENAAESQEGPILRIHQEALRRAIGLANRHNRIDRQEIMENGVNSFGEMLQSLQRAERYTMRAQHALDRHDLRRVRLAGVK